MVLFEWIWLSYGYVETALLALKYGVAAPLFPEVVNNLGKHILEVLERDGFVGIETVKFYPTDVESGAIEVARLRGGSAIAFLQS